MTDSLDHYLEETEAFIEKIRQSERIQEAAKKGIVESAQYHYEPAPGFDGRIRELARDTIFDIWAKEKRAARLREIYEGVRRRIAKDIEDGAWPTSVWNATPDKRTVDRRVNELAENNPAYWGVYTVPPCVCIRAGAYQPNPVLFADEVREEIVRA